MLNEQDHTASFCELIPWLFLANDQIVMNKDGSFMACFEIDEISFDILSNHERESICWSRQKAIEIFKDEPISLWWNIYKKEDGEYPSARFPDPLSSLIDGQRKKFFCENQHDKIYFYCSVIFHPRVGMNKFFQQFYFFHKKKNLSIHQSLFKSILFYFGENTVFPYLKQEMVEEIAHFEKLLQRFAATLSPSHIKRLINSDGSLGRFLHLSINPCSQEKNIILPHTHWLIDSFIPNNKLSVHDNTLVFHGPWNQKKTCSALTIKVAGRTHGPDETSPHDEITNILNMPCEMSLSLCFHIFSQKETRRYIQKMKKLYSYQMYSWKAYLSSALFQSPMNEEKSIRLKKDLFEQCDDLQYAIDRSEMIMGKQNYTVLIYGSDTNHLHINKKKARRFLDSTSCLIIDESDHLLASWSVTQPGMNKECCRWHILSSANVADHLPIVQTHRNAPAQTKDLEKIKEKPLSVLSSQNNQKIYLYPFTDNNGHCFIVGPTGSGKSVLANFQMSQFRRYPHTCVIVIDYDYSSKVPILLQDGVYIDCSDTNEHAGKINPFVLLGRKKSWPWLRHWIADLFADDTTHHEQDQEIDEILESMAHLSSAYWNLKTFSLHLSSEKNKQKLRHWLKPDIYNQWFCDHEDIFDHSFRTHHLIGIEMKNLINQVDQWQPILSYILYRIEDCVEDQKNSEHLTLSMVYIAECWQFLTHPHLVQKVNRWLKTWRKHFCCLWMDTQSIEDFSESRIFPTIRDNIATKIFLANQSAFSQSNRNVYHQEFGLNEQQIAYLRDATPRRDCLILQEEKEYAAFLHFDELSLKILSSDLKNQKNLDLARRGDAKNWKERYCAQ